MVIDKLQFAAGYWLKRPESKDVAEWKQFKNILDV